MQNAHVFNGLAQDLSVITAVSYRLLLRYHIGYYCGIKVDLGYIIGRVFHRALPVLGLAKSPANATHAPGVGSGLEWPASGLANPMVVKHFAEVFALEHSKRL